MLVLGAIDVWIPDHALLESLGVGEFDAIVWVGVAGHFPHVFSFGKNGLVSSGAGGGELVSWIRV